MMPYEYNPHCDCDWCRNSGGVPQDHPERGHGFGYEQPHNPPVFWLTRQQPATAPVLRAA